MNEEFELVAPLRILYQDEHLVAVDKPAGMMVHRSRLDPAHRIPVLQRLRDQLGRWVNPIHRLDRPTSGVLLFGLDPASTHQLSEAFAERRVKKTYWAIVRGHPPLSGRVDYAIKDEANSPKAAVTDWSRLATIELPISVGRYPTARYGLLELFPTTGRKHQIRKHCAHLRHPIIGDTTHGEGRHNRLFRTHFDVHRLLLYAQQLIIPHPLDGRPVRITAPIDDELDRLGQTFGWDLAHAHRALQFGEVNLDN